MDARWLYPKLGVGEVVAHLQELGALQTEIADEVDDEMIVARIA